MKWLCEAAVCAGKVYCEADYLKSVAPKCSKCLQPVAGESISMGKRVFHPKCLKCTTCRYITMVTVFHAAASVPLHQCTTVLLHLCRYLCAAAPVSLPLCCCASLCRYLCVTLHHCLWLCVSSTLPAAVRWLESKRLRRMARCTVYRASPITLLPSATSASSLSMELTSML